MKPNQVDNEFEGERRREFMRALLDDVQALETMLEEGMIEEGVRRIGAEQEMFLVDHTWRPAPGALKMLDQIKDPHFTTELGMFNLEMNTDPVLFEPDCLMRLENQINELLIKAREAAGEIGYQIVLTGILPTIRKTDLGIENMTPKPRYLAINRALKELRGGDYEFYIKGLDELLLKHDSVMLEACNTSFQLHFQVGAKEFPNLYNVAQVAAGPCLAAAVNSPLLFGRRLWAETRIALFQQSVDTRSSSHHIRDASPRVTFGNHWVKNSVLEIYREDIVRFRTLIGTDLEEHPQELLAQGKIPELKVLRLHNGTVYRWNRACYGITDGKPHLRIENRVMPSGPSILDEMANAAFWYGLIITLSHDFPDITKHIEFDHAKGNFVAAARHGLTAHFTWLEGKESLADRLILDELLPMAEAGLFRRGIRRDDIQRYLGVIDKRVRTGMTGSKWMMKSLESLRGTGTMGERLNAITAATVQRQMGGQPVAEWEPVQLTEAGGWKHNYFKVEQYMTTDIFSVREDESVDLVANLMEWEKIRYVPVEDADQKLVGLISYRSVLRLLARGKMKASTHSVSAADLMKRELITVAPETATLEAIRLMRRNKIGCLPVVHEGRLVGIVTEHDFMDIAAELLERKLGE
ncbi:MAG: CBS domain-containing protein [Candidatus Eisenbacteria bacterium]|nr:CBS domain-containing protein [Candidatus Eisenbacteria bacterium]